MDISLANLAPSLPGPVTKGALYKNKSRHPTRLFLVTNVRPMKEGHLKKVRVWGVETNDNGHVDIIVLDQSEFTRLFPYVMWIPTDA